MKFKILILAILLFLFVGSVCASDNVTDLNQNTNDEIVVESNDVEIDSPSTVDVNSTKKAEIEISVTDSGEKQVLSESDFELNLTIEDKTTPITDFQIANDKLSFNLADNNFKTGKLLLNYKNIASKNITLNNIINVNIIPIKTTAQYQSGNFTFKVIDADSGNIVSDETIVIHPIIKTQQIVFTPSINIKTDGNGIATLTWNNLMTVIGDNPVPAGQYETTINGAGQLKGSNKTTLTVEKVDVNIEAKEYREDKDSGKKFSVKVTSKENGSPIKGITLSIYMPQTTEKYYKITTDNNGIGEIQVNLGIGEYSVSITTNDSNVNAASASTKIIINKIKANINVDDKTMYFNTGDTVNVKVTDSNGKSLSNVGVRIDLYESANSAKDYYYKTDKNGNVAFSTSLDVGSHKVIVSLYDNTYDATPVQRTITVKKANGILSPSSNTVYYKDSKYLVANLKNTVNKKPIFNAKLKVIVYLSKNSYNTYYGTTDINGHMKLNVNLKPGTYKVIISGEDSKNFDVKKITTKLTVKKTPAKITAKKITAKKGAKKLFSVKLINKKTNKVISKTKVKIKVYTGKKYKTYTVKTNAKGIGSLNTKSLKKGLHKTIVSLSNSYYSAKNVKTSIKIK